MPVYQGFRRTFYADHDHIAEWIRFKDYVTPEQRSVRNYVESKGGAKQLISDDKLLQKLLKSIKTVRAAVAVSGSSTILESSIQRDEISSIQTDLAVKSELATRSNEEQFSVTFQVMEENMKREMQMMLRRESDRIIDAVTAGPQNKIEDKVRAHS